MLLLATIFVVSICSVGFALNPNENTTVEVNSINLTVPKTDNYTITDIKGIEGSWTYTYSDEKNDITVYVCDEIAPEYSMTETYNQYEGYCQMKAVKDKYVVVCSKYPENKDFVFNSLDDANS